MENIVHKYRKNELSGSINRYCIPFSVIEYEDDTRVLGLRAIQIQQILKRMKIDSKVYVLYNEEKLLIIERSRMTYKLTIDIPYKARSQYIDVIYDMNFLVEASGFVCMYTNNYTYDLRAGLIIETSKKEIIDKIKEIALENQLEIILDIGVQEVTKDLGKRLYNIQTFIPNQSKESIKLIFDYLFFHPEEKDFMQNGYIPKVSTRKKLFISYSHKDKNTVHDIVQKFKDAGLNFWIDEEEIAVGERILNSVNKGMDECDMPIIFLSEHTKEAKFANHELVTFFNMIIYGEKEWFIVKLDQVRPNDIYKGLGDFMYFDYSEKSEGELIEALMKKLNK